MITIANRNLRALDRVFDRMTGFSGMSSPLAMVDGFFDRMERDIKVACQPENGVYTVYEMKPVTYQIETNDRGDVIHRRLSEDEVKALQTNKEEDAKS
mgnify:FL=1